ncbi:hypothetical protein [Mycolicibacterium celeriflavum]|uniref:hypothetical protein n=1 Tax=Mycolicibacterium celeriflavum TaxID=1249101 RepID=UPI0010542C64|nr:hypothetical protein [Mycolicibacterium celeriflavum]MCV7240908.1 hypothetical protein [Mycolicibacterium celeriflavum]
MVRTRPAMLSADPNVDVTRPLYQKTVAAMLGSVSAPARSTSRMQMNAAAVIATVAAATEGDGGVQAAAVIPDPLNQIGSAELRFSVP